MQNQSKQNPRAAIQLKRVFTSIKGWICILVGLGLLIVQGQVFPGSLASASPFLIMLGAFSVAIAITTAKDERSSLKRPVNKVAKVVVILVLIVIVIARLVLFNLYTINGPSMAPNYPNGSKVVSTRFYGSPRIGDVVIINFPDPSVAGTKVGIKRIVAVGGDKVTIQNGMLTVFDSTHPGGFVPDSNLVNGETSTTNNAPISITIPVNDVYVLGDNRADSLDSREFGPLPMSAVLGKVILNLGG